jgi:hypothetical protein
LKTIIKNETNPLPHTFADIYSDRRPKLADKTGSSMNNEIEALEKEIHEKRNKLAEKIRRFFTHNSKLICPVDKLRL